MSAVIRLWFINDGKYISRGSILSKNLDKEAMHFFSKQWSQNKAQEGREVSTQFASQASSCCSCTALTHRNSKATLTIQSVYDQNSTSDSSGSVCTDLQKLSLLSQTEEKRKRKPDSANKITANTFLFSLLHALCWKICARSRIVSVSLVVDMLTQCFEFATWWRRLICKCWRACRAAFCQPAVRGGWNARENLSDVAALKPENPAVAAEQPGNLCMHCHGRPHLRGGGGKKSSTELLQKLTNVCRWCVVAAAGRAACFWALGSTAGARRHRRAVVVLSLLIKLLPFDPVGVNHVNHRLKFGIQLDQRLGREYMHHCVIMFWVVLRAKRWPVGILTVQTS